MVMPLNLIVVLYLFLSMSCEAYNVLVIIPFGLKSHFINMRPIALELAARGHNVTVISGVKEVDPPENYKHIDTYYKTDFRIPNMFEQEGYSTTSLIESYKNMTMEFTENALRSEGVQDYILHQHDFDVVIAEQFFNEAFYYFSYQYNCPLILVATFGNCMKHNIVVGNPLQLRYLQSEYLRIETFDLWSLVLNLYATLYEYVNWKYGFLSQQEDLAKKYLKIPDDAPSLYSIQRSAVLLLMNRHYNFETPAAFLPNLVEVGGIHFSHSKEQIVDDDFRNILQNPNGVIFVSFGSSLSISQMPSSKKEALFSLFKKLNQTVLLKNDKKMENLPNNVIVKNWFPQRKILAHPHFKLFITHGGLHSVLEAMMCGVPLLGVPIFADQNRNILQAQKFGFGRILNYKKVEVDLEATVKEMLNNKSYKENAVKMSRKYIERQHKPLDVAVSHIERVLKHRDLFMNPNNEFSWLDFYLVDLFVLFLIVFVIFACFFVGIWKCFIRMFKKPNDLKIKHP